ncbi:hypothetical protein ABB26_10120 [Stenotrophomonas humi]|uniref:Uncharacterized protein n=1 Tax=Stenotrophomonas humi TaxID=405444 RepID=A0A0R0CF33_9GAMM|nr:hypothetical protein [Stenotrophomonas humi]KRG63923.1 hypothetical protein ABB26_10120 [Stenotrophomonas humi]
MALQQPTSDQHASAARHFDNQECPRYAARAAIDDTALDALRATPSMLEEMFGAQMAEFFAQAARLLDSHKDAEFAALIRSTRDSYVNGQVEDVAEYEELSINGAINHLLRECAA